MEIKLDINELIRKTVSEIDFDEDFKSELKKTIQETIKKTMKDALGTWSPLSKALDEMLKNNLKFDTNDMTIPQYNNFVVLQCEEVVKDLMSEERAKTIQKALRDRLAPNLVTEIEFDELIDQIKEPLLEAIKEEAESHNPIKYKIVCTEDSGVYSKSWKLVIYDGHGVDFHNEEAVLCFNDDGKYYHSRGRKRENFAKLFASYVFNNTLIKNFEDYEKTLTVEDL